MTDRPWFKISFAESLSGEALVSRFPRKGHKRVKGRWYVFDRNANPRGGNTPLFDAETAEACYRWIEEQPSEIAHRAELMKRAWPMPPN